MRKNIVPLMNDQLDKHNERMALSALEDGKDQINANIMLSYMEHDYRFPPIGRIHKAFIKNENGINSLYGEIEIFEIRDVNKQNIIPNKELQLKDLRKNNISYDRSYEINGLKEDVKNLQKTISNEEPIVEIKKSLEPVSTLIIAFGVIAVKSFIEGFFNKAGSDFWDGLNKLITKHSALDDKEKKYIFSAIINRNNLKIEVMIHFTNPTTHNLKNILLENQQMVDSKVDKYGEDSVNVAKIVFNYNGCVLEHSYSVYQDGTPFDIKDINTYKKILSQIRF